ncbi:hypothetical protein [Mariniflexile sp. AS56]|uniref:hypothetical protein n=1 Tax=Mariniflexile sp. AS56 TaxID=3063957 RepID=UPI0026F3307A|nr:hypothetical protein [Mariniflexile sp. AS56]MDO7173674.1 hypothetical protein [Mariniflexile sp. AS56]
MKVSKITLLLFGAILLNSCASRYEMIQPKSLNYLSSNKSDDVILEYKYDLLDKKYAKKEEKKDLKLVAVKVTNNSDKDLIFGKDIKLTYENGSDIYILENESVFKSLKQSPATHLFYLLLTPVNFYTATTNQYGMQETTSSTPIGLILGPGLAAGNMIAAGSANKKFKNEIQEYNLNGKVILKGQTAYGLIGIKSSSFNSIKVKVE